MSISLKFSIFIVLLGCFLSHQTLTSAFAVPPRVASEQQSVSSTSTSTSTSQEFPDASTTLRNHKKEGAAIAEVARLECAVCPSHVSRMTCEKYIVSQERIKNPRNKNRNKILSRELHSSIRSFKLLEKMANSADKGSVRFAECFDKATGRTSVKMHNHSFGYYIAQATKIVHHAQRQWKNVISERLPNGIEGNLPYGQIPADFNQAEPSPQTVRDPIFN